MGEEGAYTILNGFGTVINSLGQRAKPYLPQVGFLPFDLTFFPRLYMTACYTQGLGFGAVISSLAQRAKPYLPQVGSRPALFSEL